jgi:MOSC domain-containing protein YiiM
MPGGRLSSIQISDGGVPKRAVAQAQVSSSGLEGDRQRDPRWHWGPDRAVSLYSLERIEALGREGHPIAPGSTGENLTLAEIDWGAVAPGAELRVGQVRLLVTSFAAPCENIAGSFAGGEFRRISQKLHPGWSRACARVLEGGLVRAGDPVEVRGAPAGGERG